MKRLLLLTLLAGAGLHATTIDLAVNPSDTGSGNTSFTFSNGGLSVTVSSFSNFNGGATFTAASIQQFGDNIGLGVCNTAELQRNQCNQDDWQISSFVENQSGGPANGTYRDFLLFSFNQNVTVESLLQIQSSTNQYDNDFQWWYSTNAITNATFTGLGQFTSGGNYNGSGLQDGNGLFPFASNTAVINTPTLRTLLIAAGRGNAPSLPDSSDKFKLTALDATTVVTTNEVPEPGSMALLGSGLVGLGLVARRRRK